MKEEARLGDALKSFLRDIGRVDVLELGEIHGRWKEIAGERLSRWSEPVALRQGRLTVLVTAPAWASEVHMASGDIRMKIERETGLRVEEIKVRTDPSAAGSAPPPPKT